MEGRKYIKLTGFEVPTVENETRAREFAEWYALEFQKEYNGIRQYLFGSGGALDEDLLTDTFLKVYDAIALKGARVENYRAYFLTAYRNEQRAAKTKTVKYSALHESIDDAEKQTAFKIASPEEDMVPRDIEGEKIEREILEYVRSKYEFNESAVFEIYLALKPNTSYQKISRMFGLPYQKIWVSLGAIRKDVLERFSEYRDRLQTVLN